MALQSLVVPWLDGAQTRGGLIRFFHRDMDMYQFHWTPESPTFYAWQRRKDGKPLGAPTRVIPNQFDRLDLSLGAWNADAAPARVVLESTLHGPQGDTTPTPKNATVTLPKEGRENRAWSTAFSGLCGLRKERGDVDVSVSIVMREASPGGRVLDTLDLAFSLGPEAGDPPGETGHAAGRRNHRHRWWRVR